MLRLIFFVFSIVMIIAGSFIIAKPSGVWESSAYEEFEYYTEPSKFKLVLSRIMGVISIIVGVLLLFTA